MGMHIDLASTGCNCCASILGEHLGSIIRICIYNVLDMIVLTDMHILTIYINPSQQVIYFW